MNYRLIPLSSEPAQSFVATIPVDGQNKRLSVSLRYNGMGEYWWMTVTDPESGRTLLDSVPLLPGIYPAANLLRQYSTLGLGGMFIIPLSDDLPETPTGGNLEGYCLVWGDSV